jgi:hypothetical protein
MASTKARNAPTLTADPQNLIRAGFDRLTCQCGSIFRLAISECQRLTDRPQLCGLPYFWSTASLRALPLGHADPGQPLPCF